MFSSDGLRLDLTIIQSLLGKYQFLYVLIIHDDKLHHLPQHSLLKQLPLTRLLHPLQVTMQEVNHR